MDFYRTRVLIKDDVNKLLDDYYQAGGWDIKTGNPTKEKLREYGVSI
jgi:aldehyde:ferredoxin oxidoreductase